MVRQAVRKIMAEESGQSTSSSSPGIRVEPGSGDLAALRGHYTKGELNESDLKPDPIEQFAFWFEQAMNAGLVEPNAMSLATVSAAGGPSLRVVLLKSYDRRGFVFYTNLESRKAREIAGNPSVALLFAWLPLERQLIITGKAERISAAETLKYFITRPRGSQIGAWVSHQSSAISSRKVLEMEWEHLKRKFGDGQIPLPSFWGGYRVVPQTLEFWQGRPNRLHDRFLYTRRDDGTWTIERLAP
jgi:pyridoxamine 5'-phosphate oxidase